MNQRPADDRSGCAGTPVPACPKYPAIVSGRWIALYLGVFLAAAIAVTVSDKLSGKSRGDFTRYSLAASRAMLAGGNPYSKAETGTNYKYLPANAVVLYPWAKLPNHVAQGIWFGLNLMLLVICIRAHVGFVPGMRLPWWVWALPLALSFRFLVMNLKLGQWNLPVYTLAFLGLALLHRGRLAGAILLGLSAVLKYMPTFFLVYLLARRKWAQAGAVAIAMVFWALVLPTAVLGPQRHVELLREYRTASDKSYSRMTEGWTISSHSVRAVVYRLLTPASMQLDKQKYFINVANLPRETASRVADGAAVAVLFAATLFVAWRSRRPVDGPQELLLIGFWFALLLTISPEVRSAHLLTLFTPAFALLAYGHRFGPGRCRAWCLGIAAAAALLLSLPAEVVYETTYQNWFEAYGTPTLGIVLLAFGAVRCLMGVRMAPHVDG